MSNLTSTNGMACKGWLLENEKQANYVEQKAEEVKLFMAYAKGAISSNNIWFLDNRYSNHTIGIKVTG